MLKKSLVAVATCMSMAVMANNTIVEMKTSMGNIEIELFNDKAPISAKNFEDYTKAKFYNGHDLSSRHSGFHGARWGHDC